MVYVHFMLVATGGCVVRLWHRGMCVYHVWLCSNSQAINHTDLCVFVWEKHKFLNVCVSIYEIASMLKC